MPAVHWIVTLCPAEYVSGLGVESVKPSLARTVIGVLSLE